MKLTTKPMSQCRLSVSAVAVFSWSAARLRDGAAVANAAPVGTYGTTATHVVAAAGVPSVKGDPQVLIPDSSPPV